ncbi:MAG: hypothetical protein SVR04_11785 [Spirochaetota bacterium]|nr:hypothetical protein [Spirochaetota bacterium]
MERILFILSISLGSVALGYLVRRTALKGYFNNDERMKLYSKKIKFTAIFILNPIPIIISFWKFSLESSTLLVLPVLGILLSLVGGTSALIVNKFFRIPPKQAASVFTAGMFSNILTFGGLTAYIFYGIQGYVLIQLFNIFVSMITFFIGYPMSHRISIAATGKISLSCDILRTKPYLLIPFLSLLTGIALNLMNIPTPNLLTELTAFLIPLISICLGFSIGITLFLSKISRYTRELLLIAFIKFFISPIVMVPFALLLGLDNLMDGVPFNIVLIASVMPVAFNSLIPPSLYDFDLDLANSAWIVTTSAFGIVLPVLYLILMT